MPGGARAPASARLGKGGGGGGHGGGGKGGGGTFEAAGRRQDSAFFYQVTHATRLPPIISPFQPNHHAVRRSTQFFVFVPLHQLSDGRCVLREVRRPEPG